MTVRGPKHQRGALLVLLAAMFVLGASWAVVTRLRAAVRTEAPERVAYNARLLADAKAALIGWVATTALDAAENNPGRLPCPQAWGDVGSVNEGRAAGNCASTAVGWLPWRTLGLTQTRDASGQQLWYIVSPGWHATGAGNLTINSNSMGQLTVDGRSAVALIIAPGPALSVAPTAAQLAAGCTARTQSQALALPGTPPNVLDFLECQNGTPLDNVFTTAVVGNTTNPVFNDQVAVVTAADLMPALEAAIAKRIERDIVPVLKDVYSGATWGLAAGPPAARLFPFAAPFADPGPGAGSSNYAGAAGTYQGLLPFNIVNCTASVAEPRCLPGAALHWWTTAPTAYDGGGVGYIQTQSCWWEAGNAARVCEGEYHENDMNPGGAGMRIEMQVTLANAAMGLRMLDTTRMQVKAKDNGAALWQNITPGHQATINADGSVTIRFWGDLPNIDSMGWGSYADYHIRIERLVLNDHAILNAATPGTGWFVRNEWYRLLYYATAATHTAASLPATPACATGTNCLRLTTWPATVPAWDKRALLVLAGRALANQARPSGAMTNYVEFQNGDGGTLYEQQPMRTAINADPNAKSPFNDRVVVLDAN